MSNPVIHTHAHLRQPALIRARPNHRYLFHFFVLLSQILTWPVGGIISYGEWGRECYIAISPHFNFIENQPVSNIEITVLVVPIVFIDLRGSYNPGTGCSF